MQLVGGGWAALGKRFVIWPEWGERTLWAAMRLTFGEQHMRCWHLDVTRADAFSCHCRWFRSFEQAAPTAEAPLAFAFGV